MTENSTETVESNETTETTETIEASSSAQGIRDLNHFAKGTWQHTLVASAKLHERSGNDRKKASTYLWNAATAAINEWEADKSDTDVYGENLYADLLDILGASRKGDASKIRTVALAVANNGLVLDSWANLSKAYGEATRLTKTVKEEKAQDDAAESVVETIAETAPKTASTPESAALVLLSKGVDGAVVAILDALNGASGEHNEAAHRAFLRAVATEVASRVQAAKPKPEPKAAKPAAPAKAKPAPVKAASTKAKPVKAAATKAKPVSASKGDPNAKPLPPKASADEMFGDETEAAPVEQTAPVAKAKPRPVRR